MPERHPWTEDCDCDACCAHMLGIDVALLRELEVYADAFSLVEFTLKDGSHRHGFVFEVDHERGELKLEDADAEEFRIQLDQIAEREQVDA